MKPLLFVMMILALFCPGLSFDVTGGGVVDVAAVSARLQSFNMPTLNLIANVSSVVI